MTLVVLGASGATGRRLVGAALELGRPVRALMRDPANSVFAPSPLLEVLAADVHDSASVAAAIGAGDVLVSGLGVRSRSEVGTLTAGARAVVAAAPARIVWLGAVGTGVSASRVGAPMRWLLRTGFGTEYGDKVAADTAILDAGGTVVHSGLLTGKNDDRGLMLTAIGDLPRRSFPLGAPRATIARMMVELAIAPVAQVGLLAVDRLTR